MKKIFNTYMQPSFLICVIILAIAGGGMKYAIEKFGVILIKYPIELIKPFSLMDESELVPYKVIQKDKITNKDILESLGTEHYIQWILEDTEVNEYSPVRYCTLFVTYYGLPDQVPHIPEECYVGSGNRKISSENVSMNIKFKSNLINNPTNKKLISVRHLVFKKDTTDIWDTASKFSRFYIFYANGEYANGRTEVREILGKNLLGKYSYFSKVEWGFFGIRYGNQCYPKREENLAASEKMLKTVLPILESEHWPNWNQINQKDK